MTQKQKIETFFNARTGIILILFVNAIYLAFGVWAIVINLMKEPVSKPIIVLSVCNFTFALLFMCVNVRRAIRIHRPPKA